MNNHLHGKPMKTTATNPVDELLTLAVIKTPNINQIKDSHQGKTLSNNEARKITSKVLLRVLRENHGVYRTHGIGQ